MKINNGIMTRGIQTRNAAAWAIAAILTGFYCLLYWYPGPLHGVIRLTDPLSQAIRSESADQWFLYGLLYTVAVLLMGFRFAHRHRHSRYQLIRTGCLVFVQLVLSFLLPGFLRRLHQPEFYFSYFWPLKPDILWPGGMDAILDGGSLGPFMIGWGILMSFVGVPVLPYFFGKRWYCSWVCGCGALAETLGDPWRHLSDKSDRAWRFERICIHAVLVLVVVLTILIWANDWTSGSILSGPAIGLKRFYGFAISATFSGVIGVGFYPLMGARVWCRFGCPQAAILGILQKVFSRFRITTNGGQCISCGNCSTYCEMGIDVRSYAQQGHNIVRASCVGCGICADVCPRGVLKLENGGTHLNREW